MSAARCLAIALLVGLSACAGTGGFGFPDTGQVPGEKPPETMSRREQDKALAEMRRLGRTHAEEAEKKIGRSSR